MRRDCDVCRSEGFEAAARVEVRRGERAIIATLNVVTGGPARAGRGGSLRGGMDAARRRARATSSRSRTRRRSSRSATCAPRSTASALDAAAMQRDRARRRRRALLRHPSRLVRHRLRRRAVSTAREMVALTRAMIDAGERLAWPDAPVVDKHCVGGLPGNRTTPIVVPIVAAFGLTMPKTSSRAITSPAGTADTMETLAPVALDLAAMRRVVEREGGCIVWGGALGAEPRRRRADPGRAAARPRQRGAARRVGAVEEGRRRLDPRGDRPPGRPDGEGARAARRRRRSARTSSPSAREFGPPRASRS